jgi:tetratricopeptide (TPR) repeat protein
MTQADFYAGINKIVNYFARTSKGGFLFCSHEKTLVLRHIAKTVIERAAQKELDIKELYLTAEDAEVFWRKIRDMAGEKPDGIIISNLDELIVVTKEQIIKDFNLSRDILLGLSVQILICLSRENISKFANQASDLFLRRDRSVIYFPDPPEETKIDKIRELFTSDFLEPVDFKSTELKIGLLEKQLEEAVKKRYKPTRIANEIVLDLIDAYVELWLQEEATRLFDKYREHFNLEDNRKTIDIIGRFYKKTYMNDEALDCFSRSKTLSEAIGDDYGIAKSLVSIGSIYTRKREFDKALEYHFKAKEIVEKKKYDDLIASALAHIGYTYLQNGEYDKSLDYYLRVMGVYEEKKDKRGLAWIYYSLGTHYSRKEEQDKALDYFFKSRKICGEIGRYDLLWKALSYIGNIYFNKAQFQKALENYKKSEKILKKLFGSCESRKIALEIEKVKEAIHYAQHVAQFNK